MDSFITWARAVISKAREAGFSKILFDNRTFRLNLSSSDVNMFSRITDAVGINGSEFRFAVLFCPGNTEACHLAEIVFADKVDGYMEFGNQQDAQEWLNM
ncbi:MULTISPECIES: hypothetical protein [unclassified Pseudodesulfovibrio]|uniref:hypothetical protein n=1 Tax=unclassified Pseudodesulfovibrio TaxID=2661612 RepID=UPI000FEC09F5|nr:MULTISPECIES: hypothetical protein [unclassified Pseudodesulfovibrio]MCJ2164013.1 hypothetical protein [Pseudodesulfovibrio sp. S3-i]